jgi:hypothetical protein
MADLKVSQGSAALVKGVIMAPATQPLLRLLCLEALLVSVGVTVRGLGGQRSLLWKPGGTGRGLWVSASCDLGLEGGVAGLALLACRSEIPT